MARQGKIRAHAQDALGGQLGEEAEALGSRVLGQLMHRVVADDLGGGRDQPFGGINDLHTKYV